MKTASTLSADLFRQRIASVSDRIAEACHRAGRDPGTVKVVAVTKTHPLELVNAAISAGLREFGENRVQEAVPKITILRETASAAVVSWHLIGHLQTNKAALAVKHFDLIHSVDSLRLAQAINAASSKAGKTTNVLLQMNIAQEATKSGAAASEAMTLLEQVLQLEHLRFNGFMTIAPLVNDPQEARPVFRELAQLAEQARQMYFQHPNFSACELSMGMTNDFEAAVEEGSTIVRIGSALFGQRA